MKNPNRFYVYAHQRLDDDSIFYIGKGTGKRAWGKRDNRHWKNIVKKADYRVLIIQDQMNETDAFTLEKFLIVFYGRADLGEGRLVNMTDGGDGQSGLVHSDKTKKKMSESKKGAKHSDATRKKIAESGKGKSPSAETRKKMSDALKGKSLPQFSEETKKKMSESAKARWNKNKLF
jgi:hypothetical protein